MAKRFITVVRRGVVVQGSSMEGIAEKLRVHRNSIRRIVLKAEEMGGIYWTHKYEVFVTSDFIRGKKRGISIVEKDIMDDLSK